jgi:hypothetical protein
LILRLMMKIAPAVVSWRPLARPTYKMPPTPAELCMRPARLRIKPITAAKAASQP